jgi:CheY-like chemotaxis protein
MARILIADDDAATRELARRALESEGHAVTAAQDGSDALERFEAASGAFDLLVSDVEMPGLDGIALVGRLRAIAPELRVVLMSGFAGSVGRAEEIGAPEPRMISKPFTLDQLRSAVKAALA